MYRMKLLHTADLHLGKTLHEASLLQDQEVMLDQLASELAGGEYAALIIAGDIYDRAVPPAEAVALFGSFLSRVRSAGSGTQVFIIPGNHDSSQRLSFAGDILGREGIHIIGDPENSFSPIILSKDKETLALFLLPFLAAGTLSVPEVSDPDLFSPQNHAAMGSTQAELAREASRRYTEILLKPEYARMPTVLVAHLFAQGGEETGSERIFVGSAERVAPAFFSRFSYTALGHLHKPQRVTDRMYYAGSPLAYAFDEANDQKCFLSVEIDCARAPFPVTVTKIPVTPFRRVTRESGTFDEFYATDKHKALAADWLEITLTDSALVSNPMGLLRTKFPHLLSVRQGSLASEAEGKARSMDEVSKARRDPISDFSDFETDLYGTCDESKRALFAELLAEVDREA